MTQQPRELKPARTYDEQIERLVEVHGLLVPDANKAKHILQKVNYYRLSGYGIGLLDKKTDRYRDGTSIDTLLRLYQFDSKLRNAITPVIEFAEVHFRTVISYHLGTKYGAECYRNSQNFCSWYSTVLKCDMFDKFNNDVNDAIKRQGKKPLVIHHNETYGGHFPIWVVVEMISLGSLSTLYSIMKPDDKQWVAKCFKTKSAYMKSWFASLVEIRNICAHFGRLYNMPLDSQVKLPKEWVRFSNRRLFSVCLALQYFMRNTDEWKTFLSQLKQLICDYPEVNLSFIGFPDDWQIYLQ